tara:strand:+ start:2032 stop:2421 length:390 start_codon:yes stop_codon:yes gene_type:complete
MTLKGLLNKQKIRVACSQLDCDTDSRLYLAMHYAAENGMTTEESFEIPMGDFEALEKVSGKWMLAVFANGYSFEELREAGRMTSDPLYRKKHFEIYNKEVKPLVENLKLIDVLKNLIGYNTSGIYSRCD